MLTSAQNSAVTRTELDAVFYQEFYRGDSHPSEATADTAYIFKPLSTTNDSYIEEVFKGSGYFKETGEIGTVAQETPQVTNKMTTLVKDYTDSIPVSKNFFDDNKHGVWSESVRDFADMARRTMDNNAFGIFRGAFDTTLTADGVALISASHITINGDTVSNLVAGALTPTTLNTAMVALQEQKAQNGTIKGVTPNVLLVPPALWKKAYEITESALEADTANNNINVYRSAYGFMVYTSPYLGAASGGSDTAWFLMAKNHSVRRLIRQGIETGFTDWMYSNNRTYNYQANFRESYYAVDYSGIVGATGV